MKSAGCLLIIVFEILLFVVVSNVFKHNSEDDAVATDSLNTAQVVTTDEGTSSSSYVQPYTDRNGHFHSGHVRKCYSLDPKAYQHRARSRYYNHTHIRKHSH
jgi:hypothetical protein